ncbi:MAG TPA: PEP-utilizing enzyme, partial [Anaerolineae bacterium]|nr:PEP-utilizing enzyme [Anaerolineae bacterium]
PNPSWIALYSVAAGLVTDTGGILSHAAVIAREFGVPAVVGTGDATRRIKDGQRIEVDGTSGEVRIG